MKMNNIPVLIQQLAENALDTKQPEHIRYNYMVALESVRNYCDTVLNQYNKKNGKR
jgi:hypothetical protein